jgi:DNA replicative helicase MCM subunit Mcm2 (Cdc46/Mcm family)
MCRGCGHYWEFDQVSASEIEQVTRCPKCENGDGDLQVVLKDEPSLKVGDSVFFDESDERRADA